MTITPNETSVANLFGHLLSAIAPRPIAFVSTIDRKGIPNLGPFSFFNVFSSNPPVVVFSPARRVRDNTTKHTLDNIEETGEAVVNVVSYDMVQQMSLASTEYPKGVNEFIKAGFTQQKSELIKPFRVKESPVQMECELKEIIKLGNGGGAGNLVICEIIMVHIKDSVLNTKKEIDPDKIKLVGRLGKNWYCKAFSNALFEVPKPLSTLGIGVDNIPAPIRLSKILTGNDLGMLGNIDKLPEKEEILTIKEDKKVSEALNNSADIEGELHKYAQELLSENKINTAWKVLLVNKI